MKNLSEVLYIISLKIDLLNLLIKNGLKEDDNILSVLETYKDYKDNEPTLEEAQNLLKSIQQILDNN